MAASYPSSLKTFTTKTNKVDDYDASHINDIQDEVTAIETELGTDVAGSSTDLTTRLAVSIEDDGSIKGGSSFPGTPVADQLFVRTDQDILYRRNTGDTAWLALGGAMSRVSSTTGTGTNTGDITIEQNKFYRIVFHITNKANSGNDIILKFNSSAVTGEYFWNKTTKVMISTPGATETLGNADNDIDVATIYNYVANTSGGYVQGVIELDTTQITSLTGLDQQAVFTMTGGFVDSSEAFHSITMHGRWIKGTSGGTTITDFEFASGTTMDYVVHLYEYNVA